MTTTWEIKRKEDSPSLSEAQKFVGGWVASKMYADKYGDADIIVGDAIYIPHKIPSEWHS